MTENLENLPVALTVDETAKTLHIGKALVYDLVRSGKLRSLRIGRKVRVPRNALAEYLDGST